MCDVCTNECLSYQSIISLYTTICLLPSTCVCHPSVCILCICQQCIYVTCVTTCLLIYNQSISHPSQPLIYHVCVYMYLSLLSIMYQSSIIYLYLAIINQSSNQSINLFVHPSSIYRSIDLWVIYHPCVYQLPVNQLSIYLPTYHLPIHSSICLSV
jgi:hypothetical protein